MTLIIDLSGEKLCLILEQDNSKIRIALSRSGTVLPHSRWVCVCVFVCMCVSFHFFK